MKNEGQTVVLTIRDHFDLSGLVIQDEIELGSIRSTENDRVGVNDKQNNKTTACPKSTLRCSNMPAVQGLLLNK